MFCVSGVLWQMLLFCVVFFLSVGLLERPLFSLFLCLSVWLGFCSSSFFVVISYCFTVALLEKFLFCT